MNISVIIFILYVVVWLIITFILAVAYSDRPLRSRGDRFAEYLWNNFRVIFVIFWLMLILLPIVGIWAAYDMLKYSNSQDYEFIIERIDGNPDKFKITKNKITTSKKPKKTTTVSTKNTEPEPIKLDSYN